MKTLLILAAVGAPNRRTTYYCCGDSWFKPCFGPNGVYGRVVPAP